MNILDILGRNVHHIYFKEIDIRLVVAPQPLTALAAALSPSLTEHWAQSSARWLCCLYEAETRDYAHYSTYCRAPVKCDQCYWTLNIIIAVMAVKNCVNGRHDAQGEKGVCFFCAGLKQLKTHISASFKAELEERLTKRHSASASWSPVCCPWMRCRSSEAKNKVLFLKTSLLLSNLQYTNRLKITKTAPLKGHNLNWSLTATSYTCTFRWIYSRNNSKTSRCC